MSQDTLSEQELIDNLVNRTVRTMRVVEDQDNRFSIYVTLSWKEGQKQLETQRKKPRTWASLDRLVRHINSKYGHVPVIQLELRSSYEHGSSERGNARQGDR